jgi:hypothetical protein
MKKIKKIIAGIILGLTVGTLISFFGYIFIMSYECRIFLAVVVSIVVIVKIWQWSINQFM